jgi:hypothetical protein
VAWLNPKLDWTKDDYYNADDLNRVENNCSEVATLLSFLGIAVAITTITNRDYRSIEFADSLNRIENNINLLGDFYKPSEWKENKTNWVYNDSFLFKDANRLENNLFLLYTILTSNLLTNKTVGMFTCGQEGYDVL